MYNSKALKWLENQEFSQYAKTKVKLMVRVLEECIAVNGNKILIVGDKGSRGRRVAPILTYSYYLACKQKNLDVELILQPLKEQGEKADHEFENKLLNLPRNSILLIALSNKFGSTKTIKSYRKFANEQKHRFLSTPSLAGLRTENVDKLFNAINIDYKELVEYNKRLKKKLDEANKLRVETRAGTKLEMNIKGIKAIAASGVYKKPGTGGNLPGGEVYLYPEKTSANGKVIIDVCLRTKEGTQLVKKPFIIHVKEGKINLIEGGEEAESLIKTINWVKNRAKYPENVNYLAEFGIGTNKNARPAGSTIIDEKLYNTAHVAIGSNYWFGGPIKTIIHLDQVFKNPKIYLDDELLEV